MQACASRKDPGRLALKGPLGAFVDGHAEEQSQNAQKHSLRKKATQPIGALAIQAETLAKGHSTLPAELYDPADNQVGTVEGSFFRKLLAHGFLVLTLAAKGRTWGLRMSPPIQMGAKSGGKTAGLHQANLDVVGGKLVMKGFGQALNSVLAGAVH